MAKGEMPIYRGMINDDNRKQVGDVALWRRESKKGLSYLGGTITKKDGSKLRIVVFEAKGRQDEAAEDVDEDGF